MVDIGSLGGLSYRLKGGVARSKGNIFLNGSREEPGILQDHSKLAPQIISSDIAGIHAIEGDLTTIDLIEAHDQINQRGLTCSCWTNNRHGLTRLYIEVEVLDQWLIFLVSE